MMLAIFRRLASPAWAIVLGGLPEFLFYFLMEAYQSEGVSVCEFWYFVFPVFIPLGRSPPNKCDDMRARSRAGKHTLTTHLTT